MDSSSSPMPSSSVSGCTSNNFLDDSLEREPSDKAIRCLLVYCLLGKFFVRKGSCVGFADGRL